MTIAAIPPPIYIIQGVIATECAPCAHCTVQEDGQALVYDLYSKVNAEVGWFVCDTHDVPEEQDLSYPLVSKKRSTRKVLTAHHKYPVAALVEKLQYCE